jgi:CBS domain-containing protein
MRVLDCGLTRPLVVEPAASLSAAVRLAALHDVRHVAVVERGRLVGIVSTRALGAAHPSAVTSLTAGEVSGRLARLVVADVMARDPVIVQPATPLTEAVRVMRDARVDVVAVCDQEAWLAC